MDRTIRNKENPKYWFKRPLKIFMGITYWDVGEKVPNWAFFIAYIDLCIFVLILTVPATIIRAYLKLIVINKQYFLFYLKAIIAIPFACIDLVGLIMIILVFLRVIGFGICHK